MRADELRDRTVGELEEQLRDLREQLFKLRFQKSTGQIENPQILRAVRKDIARVLTVMRERELSEAASGDERAGA